MAANILSQYSGFQHDPNAPILEEFQRLAALRGWKAGSKRYKTTLRTCLQAESRELFRSDGRLDALQQLCRDVGVHPTPETITSCRKALQNVNVNIIDLIDSRRCGSAVETFRTRVALRNYSKMQGKIYPKQWAKSDDAIRNLLIRMW
ncbi:hypothetical protein M409DRAFT_58067 [Zasmidium cellare ATCC 36951]|uniref:Uncharacterized protein n=1 Tax=Zasmidium cellare ATCC 36951 TaxID=1080233 RepID=A0A6A6C6G6_ZASCE|nr:uncharacterized protein M409DRAFT_58067 [Zasmidium cellare ATCC 36951]KAF2162651.1 hypothetical protein M409DRAFT_58067 [Zasmidium cellare ATCC 36951]